VLALFSLVFAALVAGTATRESATFDEPIHLSAGHAALTRADFRLDLSHPPLVRLWAAIPSVWYWTGTIDTAAIDRTAPSDWVGSREPYDQARLLTARDVGDRGLIAGRMMVALFGIGAGWVIFFWADALFGLRTACFALAAWTLEPNVLAHAGLVTTDMPATALLLAAVSAMWRFCRVPSIWSAAAFAAAASLAIVAKFSGLLILPIGAGLLLVGAARGGRPPLAWIVRLTALTAATVVLMIWTVYGFRYLPSDTPGWIFHVDGAPGAALAGAARGTLAFVDDHRLLPNAFTEGLLFLQATDATPNNAFLSGRYSADGWWYYFPVAVLLKTPLPLLLAAAVGLAALIGRTAPAAPARDRLFVIGPPAVYAAAAMTSHLNIGVRHVLPIYPCVVILAAVGANRLLASGHRRGALALAGLGAWTAAALAGVYPHTLTYFNEAAGGPAGGAAYLTDSNLDWGQSMKDLARWTRQQHVPSINLAYFGQAVPERYGVQATYLPGTTSEAASRPQLPGYVAIGETVLSGVYLTPEWRLFYKGFATRAPLARIANSVRVFDLDEWPRFEVATPEEIDAERRLADRLTFEMRWPELAIRAYRDYLMRRPRDARALAGLGIALIDAGDTRSGREALLHAAALDPDDDWIHRVASGITGS
jgi:hypothetical protein